MMAPEFEFEKLQVHGVAMELLGVVARIIDQFPRGSGDLRDHIHRSARSIHLNIAEGSGKYTAGAKAHRYVTARASANECASGIEEARMFDLAATKDLDEARDLLNRICAMLTKLVIRWDPEG